jgi:hypothetical protein
MKVGKAENQLRMLGVPEIKRALTLPNPTPSWLDEKKERG